MRKGRKRILGILKGMKQRCYNPNCEKYPRYGGRGITVCDEWRNNPQAFYDWSMENGYADDLTIDRINNDGNYEPSNCRWATAKQQNNNRTHKTYTYNGETKTLSQWADKLGVCDQTLYSRLKNGWSIEKTFAEPIDVCKRERENVNFNLKLDNKNYSVDEKQAIIMSILDTAPEMSVRQIAEITGFSKSTVQRLKPCNPPFNHLLELRKYSAKLRNY